MMRAAENDPAAEAKWADIEADEDYDNVDLSAHHLNRLETPADSQGIKTLTSYTRNTRDQSVKITKRVKEVRMTKRTNRAVAERRNLKPFNLSEENDAGVVLVSNEDIMLELSKNDRLFNQDEGDYIYSVGGAHAQPFDASFLRLTRDLKLKFKALKEDTTVGARHAQVEEVEEKDTVPKYVPPSRKDGERRSFDENTIRITNLSEDIKEKDLTDLFGQVGRIHRAYLAKYKETQNPKGFAFVTYVNKADALAAINKFNRWGYNNLLLNVGLRDAQVEWAKNTRYNGPV